MNILSLDRLMEEVNLTESIAKDYVDKSDYNVVTKKANSPLLMEAIDASGILKHGRNLMGLLEAEEIQPKTTQQKPTQISVKVTFDNGDSLITGFNGTKEQATAYYVGKQFNLGSDKDDMAKGTKVEVLAECVTGETIDTIDKFLNAKPVSQADYVEIKTEVKKKAPMDKIIIDKSIEPKAEKAIKEAYKKTEANKEWVETSKERNELKSKLEKFEKFVTSLETEETKIVIKKITDKVKSL